MDRLVSKNQDALSPKSAETVGTTLSAFAQSLAYSGVESPARGLIQIADQALGTHLDANIQSRLARIGAHQPEPAIFGTYAWKAQQLGGAIGMVAPMWLAHKIMIGSSEVHLSSSLGHPTAGELAVREASSSAKTGFFYGAVLTPTQTDSHQTSAELFANRLKQGAMTATTFGAMGYTSSITGSVLNRVSSTLETTSLHVALKSPLQIALHSNLVHGAIGGISGGAINAQFGALENGKSLASLQDFRENISGMTLVGGVMGSVGLFKNTPADGIKESHHGPSIHDFDGVFANINERISPETPNTSKAKSDLDIKFEPIQKAWSPVDVIPHMTEEHRTIEFAAQGREAHIGTKAWSDFRSWGVDEQTVPVNVYRFPGLSTEIVVPSDYAKILDQVRLQRLSGQQIESEPASDGFVPLSRRVLPEEIAQMLKQLPQPDLVRSVELLNHASPFDLKGSYQEHIKAGRSPDQIPEPTFALADASTNGDRTIRFFNSSSNSETELQQTTTHEFAHLAEDNVAFKAFWRATVAERDGWYMREYARKNEHENWAVHFGERFLGASGTSFSELPENAPARTLVMAKALRNMLEERKDNPTPRHKEFLMRPETAEVVATRALQKQILADIDIGDDVALNLKLSFLSRAATEARSPEILTRVTTPIEEQLSARLALRPTDDNSATEFWANRAVENFRQNQSPDNFAAFSNAWRSMQNTHLQVEYFHSMPDHLQNNLLADLLLQPKNGTGYLLTELLNNAEGATKQRYQNVLDAAQNKFEQEALKLDSAGNFVPKGYEAWLLQSDLPAARTALLKHRQWQASAYDFEKASSGLSPEGIREMIAGDAMTYVLTKEKPAVWSQMLEKLSQRDQIELFRDLGVKHSAAYGELAERIATMSSVEFSSRSRQIQDETFNILIAREKTTEFNLANPRRIKTSDDFLDATQALTPDQVLEMIRGGAMDNMLPPGRDRIIASLEDKLTTFQRLAVFEAMPVNLESEERVFTLSVFAELSDTSFAAKARQLLSKIGNAQSESLQKRVDRSNAYFTRRDGLHMGEPDGQAYFQLKTLKRFMF